MKTIFYQALIALLMTSFVIVPGGVNAQTVFVPRTISGKSLPGGGLATRFAKPSADKSLLEQLISPNDSVELQTCLTKLMDDNGFADIVDAKPAKGKFLVVTGDIPDQISGNCNGQGLIIFKPVTVRIDSSNAAAMMKEYPSLSEKISKLLVPEAKAEAITIVILCIVGLAGLILGGWGLSRAIGSGSGSGSGGPATTEASDGGDSPDGMGETSGGGDSGTGSSGSGSGSGSGTGT